MDVKPVTHSVQDALFSLHGLLILTLSWSFQIYDDTNDNKKCKNLPTFNYKFSLYALILIHFTWYLMILQLWCDNWCKKCNSSHNQCHNVHFLSSNCLDMIVDIRVIHGSIWNVLTLKTDWFFRNLLLTSWYSEPF